jgi:hypothetical protein
MTSRSNILYLTRRIYPIHPNSTTLTKSTGSPNIMTIKAPRIMSQAPRVMLKPQQVVTALRIMIKPLRITLHLPRITLHRPRIIGTLKAAFQLRVFHTCVHAGKS